MREPELRERLLALYKWWYLQNLAWLGLRDVPGVEQNETLVGLGELVCAVIDGLCIQAGLQPKGFDMGRALRVFGLKEALLPAMAVDRAKGLVG